MYLGRVYRSLLDEVNYSFMAGRMFAFIFMCNKRIDAAYFGSKFQPCGSRCFKCNEQAFFSNQSEIVSQLLLITQP